LAASESGDRLPAEVQLECAVPGVGRCSGHRITRVGGTGLAMKILVVDQDRIAGAEWARRLAAHGHEPAAVVDLEAALNSLRTESIDLALIASARSRDRPLEFLRQVAADPDLATHVVIVRTGGTIPEAVAAVKLGAFDFLPTPVSDHTLCRLLDEVERQLTGIGPKRLERPKASGFGIGDTIVGKSEAIARVQRMIRVSSRTNANVLIYGETGTGKDLVASVIHQQSHRCNKPYVKVGCTLLPPALIENELFGHEAGSFTGADQPRQGRFELAEGGTIYLDDVDDIPLEQQAKLLRAIEEKEFERVGGTRLIRADVRIIASTKLNLLDKIAAGTFRQDLYYRLDVLRIRIPPLRDRMEDIGLLTKHLIARIATGSPCRIEPRALDALSRQDWPGNIRELAHALERAMLVGGGQITASLLETEIAGGRTPQPSMDGFSPSPKKEQADALAIRMPTPVSGFKAAVRLAEKELLASALEAADGNKTAAAESIGMKPSTFRDKLAKYGLG
jgi:DNA-binding NtrC family response regulator